MIVAGNIVDIHKRVIFPGEIEIADGIIRRISRTSGKYDEYIIPGFVDSHVHIESSMLIPSEFARIAVTHGTVATVSDPHEIANVLGIDGIRYMIKNGKKTPFKFCFGASSCVPATSFETAGAVIDAEGIRELFEKDGLSYLSEMMNYPGVLFEDPEVMKKIGIAKDLGRPVDGHAPGLRGGDAKKYVSAGISTDHECFTLDEALEKVSFGMKILIREGSAAKNFEALHPLISMHPGMVMFCSDDKHPNDLVEGHLDKIVARAVAHGYDLFDVLRCASANTVSHYGLNVGLLRENDPADFAIVEDLSSFKVKQTFIDGTKVSENGLSKIGRVTEPAVNKFSLKRKSPEDFRIEARGNSEVRVIEAHDGQLITSELHLKPVISNGFLVSDTVNDILKIAVTERYGNGKPSVGFIKNFGLKRGAIASCVAHDSHNIIAVGVSDEDICRAVNALADSKGGICCVDGNEISVLPLPVAGIMTNEDGYVTAQKYTELDRKAKSLGSALNAPFMTLSFMALLVIPQLKLSDKGLFDGKSFRFVDLQL
ncbi:MAG: adenine deaminase [Ignavibacteria bacterium]|nr:adenine deaminase [Ignavibacteria bacterium]